MTRITNASSRTAAARTKPICFISRMCSITKLAKTVTMTIAALVTTLAEEPMPSHDGLPGGYAVRARPPGSG